MVVLQCYILPAAALSCSSGDFHSSTRLLCVTISRGLEDHWGGKGMEEVDFSGVVSSSPGIFCFCFFVGAAVGAGLLLWFGRSWNYFTSDHVVLFDPPS